MESVPGLTGATLIALSLPLTFFMGGQSTMVLLVSMYVGAVRTLDPKNTLGHVIGPKELSAPGRPVEDPVGNGRRSRRTKAPTIQRLAAETSRRI